MKQVKFKDEEIDVEVADSVLKRSLGLSLRKKGKMLFEFGREVNLPIDMMLMRDSLHLYFMNSDKEVIQVETAYPWYKLPGKYFHRPEENYQYLLESFEPLDINEGDTLEF